MDPTELEDEVADIVRKAARGSGGWMAKGNAVDLIAEGTRFGLSAKALRQIQHHQYPLPALPGTLSGLIRRLVLPFGPYTVNAWLIGPDDNAILIDSGFEPDASTLLHLLPDSLTLKAILLTHDDRDHWGGVPALHRHFPGVPQFGPAHESPAGVTPIPPGPGPNLGGGWSLEAIAVPGHTPHGISWKVAHPDFPVPVVACGDGLFAGSIGQIRGDYASGLQTLAHQLLSLPEATVLLPGHGPITTVGVETAHNPFFAP